MKKFIFTFALLAITFAASAQTTRVIKGVVIDKKGNPLPGATVNATGGSDMATVDADGSFSMEVPIWLKSLTAQYAGMKDKRIKIKGDDIVFRMKPNYNKQWFIIANYSRLISGGYNRSYVRGYETYDYSANMGGLMFGQIGEWGWYGKFNCGNATLKCDYYFNYDYATNNGCYENETVVWSVSGGVTKKIIEPLHMYIGFGGGKTEEHHTTIFLSPEIGLIGKFKKHYLLHIGYQPMISIHNEWWQSYSENIRVCHVLNFGIGYAF